LYDLGSALHRNLHHFESFEKAATDDRIEVVI